MSRKRLYLKSLSIAYPRPLGDGMPEPPYGYMFLVDENGVYLTDDNGNFLIGPWNG